MVYADKGALRAGGAVLYAGGFLRGQRGIVCGRGGGRFMLDAKHVGDMYAG